MWQRAGKLIATLIVLAFIANAYCAAACLSFSAASQPAHDCCKHNKPVQCVNRTNPIPDAIPASIQSPAPQPNLFVALAVLPAPPSQLIPADAISSQAYIPPKPSLNPSILRI